MGLLFAGPVDRGEPLPATLLQLETMTRAEHGQKLDKDLEGMQFCEDSLEASLTFRQLVAALPRMVLKSRTRFSALLARSFHVTFNGESPCSTVFPLPLKDFGLFDKQISRGSMLLNGGLLAARG